MNTKTPKPVVLADSPEAASFKTVSGWVSRLGNFWGNDERMARYDGSTHRRCECGEIIEQRSYCRKCHDRKEQEKYLAMPAASWDGVIPLCIHGTDTYFFDVDSLLYHCEEQNCQPKDLPLVICVPTLAREIDPNEHYCDDLPEDGDIPPEIEEAFARLNAAIKACKTPLSWSPGQQAVTPESLPVVDTIPA